jgi:predicted HNH restriction endonuclease
MESVSVRWRPSGGRGEFEYVPANSLEGRDISVFFEALNLTIPAEVRGVNVQSQGKPRLRKAAPNNRNKLHLPQLVMAVARLPEPRREDHHTPLIFPLENKSFVMDAMDFDIVEDDGITVTLAPLRVSILHTDFKVDLQDRFAAIAADIAEAGNVAKNYPKIANAISAHARMIIAGVNSSGIRDAADSYIKVQAEHFGMTNAGSATNLIKFESLPETDLEQEISGKEGRMLTRVHAYKERDRKFAAMAKKHYKTKNGGKLWCVACDLKPEILYDDKGERCIEAHHKIPIEELQPDSITRVDDMAMVCASCHRVIHSRKPCLTIEEVRALRPNAA